MGIECTNYCAGQHLETVNVSGIFDKQARFWVPDRAIAWANPKFKSGRRISEW